MGKPPIGKKPGPKPVTKRTGRRRSRMNSILPEKIGPKQLLAPEDPIRIANGVAHQIKRELAKVSRVLDGKEYDSTMEEAKRIRGLYRTGKLTERQALFFLGQADYIRQILREEAERMRAKAGK
ncbi:MAG: hypothetical protein NT067_02940 [Candidatus Diapherotrites archaeon]|nr:hypothetical protein [Candidatus Diapherotrites archaeon]